jgi:hypothetical protein
MIEGIMLIAIGIVLIRAVRKMRNGVNKLKNLK